MRKLSFILFITMSASLVFLVGCVSPSQKDLDLCDYEKRLAIKAKCKGTPAEYAGNLLFRPALFRTLHLNGKLDASNETLDKDREWMNNVYDDINLGLAWKEPIPQIEIPHTATPPALDGKINSPEWQNAYVSQGAYILDQSQKKSGSDDTWKLMWDETYLYIGVFFPDSNIIAPTLPRDGLPYLYDSLEIFILPEPRTKNYWELIISPSKSVFDSLQTASEAGRWEAKTYENINGLRVESTINRTQPANNSFYTLEIAIPWKELPAYTKGNPPQVGETISLNLIRTQLDKKGEDTEFTSFKPLLYSGHNIYGMTRCKLVK